MRRGLKASKTLGIIIALVQLVGVVGFILGIHTMVGVFGSVLPSDRQEIRPEMGDPVVIPLTLNPRNDGYLDATLTFSLSLVLEGGQVIASDSATVTVQAGSQVPIVLELRVPASQFQRYLDDPDQVSWVAHVRVTSLYDLISFSDTMTIGGVA